MNAGPTPRPRLLLLPVCLLLAGCVSTDGDDRSGRKHGSGVGSRTRAELRDGEVFAVPAAEARGAAFTDFGLTVLTNKGVRQGAPIEWMVIGEIAPRSSAALAGLVMGDEILALDGVMLSELKRDALQRELFGRRPGDRIRLLVFKPAHTLPYFVELTAGRQAAD
jgi:S1-C subfamily serine protease